MPPGECAIGCNFTIFELWKDTDGDKSVDELIKSETVFSGILNDTNFSRPKVFIEQQLAQCGFYQISWYSIDYLGQQEEFQTTFITCNWTNNTPPVSYTHLTLPTN